MCYLKKTFNVDTFSGYKPKNWSFIFNLLNKRQNGLLRGNEQQERAGLPSICIHSKYILHTNINI